MMKDNLIKCDHCGVNNPLYSKVCSECKYFIRDSVVNIDLWKTVWKLFESPKEAHKQIIFAEHKNFIMFLLFFLSLKIYFISVLMKAFLNVPLPIPGNPEANLLLLVSLNSVFVILLSYVFTIFTKEGSKKLTRFRDNLALICYSHIPSILTIFILIPVEYGIFGEHWFFHNPSPFMIKPTFAYIFTGLELLMFIWSLVIWFKAMKLQSGSVIKGISFMVIWLIYITVLIFFIPYKIF